MQDLVELTVKSSSGLVMDGNGTWAEVLDMWQVKKTIPTWVKWDLFVCCLTVLGPPQTNLDLVYLEVEVGEKGAQSAS